MVDVINLSAIPRRPPTPPRSSFQSSSFKDDPNVLAGARPGQLPSPPELSPHPHSEARKKVNFSPLPSYIKPLDLSHSGTKSRSILRNLRPSNECRPAKSILKSKPASSLSKTPEQLFPGLSKEELPVMIESVTQQLAGDSHSSRSDAYTQLLGALTAYRELPDTPLLCEKMGVLTQFIRRDISQSPSTTNAQAISLVRHALNLLSMLAWHAQLSTHLSDDFKAFFLDQAISSLQNSLSKAVTVDYMRVLSVLTFPPRILVNGKVVQLLSVLKEITMRVRGKAVPLLRLTIYEKLLLHSKSVFASHATAWTDNVVTALFHEVAEIRIKAITLGHQISATVGPNNAISRAIQDTFDISAENEPRFGERLSNRLISMISSRESGVQGVHVPQIWSVVILLLRRNRWSLEQWDLLKQWLLVIQKCFNCSDPAVKLQALIAWDRFVFAVQPNEPTASKGTIKLLCRPILSQLERKRSDRSNALLSQAYASYYHLLYYAFRPSTTHDRLDLFWKEYVVRFFSHAMVAVPDYHETACRILAAMFWNPHPRIWPEGKPVDSFKLTPLDLPRLDFRWVRSRLSTILPILETLFKTASWPQSDLVESPVGVAWMSLSRCLAEASSKEIQPSQETMNAVGKLLESWQRIWRDAPASLNANGDGESEALLARFQFLSTTVISAIGPMPFTDKLVSKTPNDTFQTISTPSHRHPQNSGKPRPAIIHLLDLLRHSSLSISQEAYCELLRHLIEISLKCRSSKGSRLELLSQFADTLNENADRPESRLDLAIWTWMVIAKATKENLTSTVQSHTPLRDRDSAASRDYEKVNTILAVGARFPSLTSEWSGLLNSLVSMIHGERPGGTILPILENISEELYSRQSAVSVPHFVALLDHATVPDNGIQSAKPFLPINKISGSKSHHDAVPLEKTMALAARVLKETYEQLPSVSANDMLDTFESIIRFADRCPTTFHPTFLEKCQTGLAVWLADIEDKITKRAIPEKNFLVAIQSLLSKSARMLETCENTDSALLEKLALFVSSGLESRHKSTTNSFIRMWNATFGLQTNLTYPELVEKALRRLEPFISLLLPDFPGGAGPDVVCQPPEFLSSQEDGLNFDHTRSGVSRHGKNRKKSSSILNLTESGSSPLKDYTPEANKTESRSTPKPRLRHDDSQVQFVPVDSSPVGPPETQVLTEHQREVRDRQRTDSARLFSNIQSSSGIPQRDSTPSHTAYPLPDGQLDAPGTPQLPVSATANDDEVPLSSPTPGSKEQNARLAALAAESSFSSLLGWNSDDAGPPSSPPQPTEQLPLHTFNIAPKRPKVAEQTGNMSCSVTERRRSRLGLGDEASRIQSGSKRKDGPDMEGDFPTGVPAGNKKRKTISVPAVRFNNAPSVETEPARSAEKEAPAPSTATDDRNMVDMIPDSFSDVLEQQIASQLEQDLELSMDSALAEGDSMAQQHARQSKRKRGGKAASNGREKKATTISNSPVVEISVPAPAGDYIPEAEPSDSGDDGEPKRTTRPRRSLRSASQKTSNPPSLTRRRSSRLKGETASREPEEKAPKGCQESGRASADSVIPAGAEAPREINTLDGLPSETAAPDNATDIQNIEEATEKRPSSPNSILSSLRGILGSIKNISFGKSTLREMDDLMFNIRMEAHDAVKRHEN